MQSEFLDYFLSPKKSGYDIPKTLSYSTVLILCIYLIFHVLKRLNVKIDKRLAISVSPYILFGASIRVLEDLGILSSYFFVTPGIYFLVFSIFFASLLFSLLIKKRFGIPYFKTVFVFGIFLASFTLPALIFRNLTSVFIVLTFFIPWPIIINIFLKKQPISNRVVLSIHMLDATITFVSINFFGYREQHVIPNFLINFFGPASFIFAKLLVILACLFLIDRFGEEKEVKYYLKIIIGILGASTATRDLMSLLVLG